MAVRISVKANFLIFNFFSASVCLQARFHRRIVNCEFSASLRLFQHGIALHRILHLGTEFSTWRQILGFDKGSYKPDRRYKGGLKKQQEWNPSSPTPYFCSILSLMGVRDRLAWVILAKSKWQSAWRKSLKEVLEYMNSTL